jgi:hypothetical protein
MDATRANQQSGSSVTPQRKTRSLSDAAAQAWAAVITIMTFGAIATALNAMFQ